MTSILGAAQWPSNAELLRDVFALHVPDRAAVRVVDVTFGRGTWWKLLAPPDVRHGLALGHTDHYDDGVDFRALPEPDCTFNVAAFDPPYVAPGGRKTTTIPEFHHRFGMTSTPRTPAELQVMIELGLAEVHRVLRPGGLLLVKCQDYVWGGTYWPGAFLTLRAAGVDLEMSLIDRFEHIGRPGPQPTDQRCKHCAGRGWSCDCDESHDDVCPTRRTCAPCDGVGSRPRVQRHARRNHSTLYVLERTRPAAEQGSLL